MKNTTPKLTEEQLEQLQSLIEETILPALSEDGICEPNMDDVEKDHPAYDNVWCDRHEELVDQAIKYLKDNMYS
jgi:hypothetical protein